MRMANSAVLRLSDASYKLPAEIWEKILRNLTDLPRSLVSASKVCLLWRNLITRICYNYCVEHYNSRLLRDISHIVHSLNKLSRSRQEHKRVTSGAEWIKGFWLRHEADLQVESGKDRCIVATFETYTKVYNADPYLVLSSYGSKENKTSVCVLSSLDFSFEQNVNEENHLANILDSMSQSLTFDIQDKILNINILIFPTPVLLLSTSTDVRAAVLNNLNPGQDSTRYKIVAVKPKIKIHTKSSSEGHRVLSQDADNDHCLLLYEASLVEGEKESHICLHLKWRMTTEASSYSYIISGDLIKTMEASGHIRVYKIPSFDTFGQSNCLINSEENLSAPEASCIYAESTLKKDMRYPNPTLLTSHFIFSSTFVSRDLLKYWHMDRDRDYWLIGETTPKIDESSSPLSIHLHQVTLGQEAHQAVTAVHYQRGILLCGTNEGHLIGYELLRNDFESSKTDCFAFLSGLPWLNVTSVLNEPVYQLGTLFTPSGLLVAVGGESGRCVLLHIALRE